MKTAPRFSGPVLTFGIIGLAIILLASWYGYRRQQLQPLPEPDIVAASTLAAENPASEPVEALIPPAPLRTFAGELPPVVPIHLGDLIVEPENSLWLKDTSWLSQPRGTQTLAGVEFHIHGLIQLQSTASVRAKQSYRSQVLVPLTEANLIGDPALVTQLRSNVGCLHLLGALRYGGETPAGTRVAEIIWHYEDGTSERTPLEYNVSIRDWWRTRYEEPERLPYAGAKVVWRGEVRSASDRSLRLYRVSLQNPAPGKPLQALEFVSAMANPSLFFVALSLDPLNLGERPDTTPDLEEIDPPGGKLEISVQDSDGQRLAGVRVRTLVVQKAEGKTTRANKSFTSDANGQVRFRFANVNLEQLEIAATLEGSDYSGQKMLWDLTTGETIPANYTFTLATGISLGGTVVDEADQPVAEAKLNFYRFWSGSDDSPNKPGNPSDFQNKTVTTDATGRWQLRGVPQELLQNIGFNLTHPDFVGTNFNIRSSGSDEAKLRDGTHKVMLRRGLVVKGRVLDESDNPIKDAQVWAGRLHYSGTQEIKTDASGVFSFRGVLEGAQPFSVLAKNFKPVTTNLVVKAGMEEIIFRLGAGLTLRGIVKDEAGQPVAGVRISLEGEHGGVSQDYRMEMTSDQEGRFEWNGAPSDEELKFCFLKQGYESKRSQKLMTSTENIVTLRKGRKVQAWVVDAETGKPITKFRGGVGRLHNQGTEHEYFYAEGPGLKNYSDVNGSFTAELDEEAVTGIKAEADDYAAATEKLPEAENGVVQVTLRLKPSASIRGVLVNSQGTPVPNASVALTRENSWGGSSLQLRRGRLTAYGNGEKVATTDAEGKFTLGSPPETGGIVVASSESGFARATVDEVRNSGRLVLQEFGRIEGSITIAGSPMAGQEFMFSLMKQGISTDWETYKASSDDQGHFSFEKIPPGEGQVVRLIKTTERSWMHSHQTTVNITSGQTTQVKFGAEGAVIKGRVQMESPPAEGQTVSLHGNLSATRYDPQSGSRYYAFTVGADGFFSLDSIPPGEYSLSVTANVPKSGRDPWNSQTIASGGTQVTVPESASPYAPIGLSDIILKPVSKPSPQN